MIEKKKSYYWNTLGINLLIIILIPLAFVTLLKSPLAMAAYLVVCSAVEMVLDVIGYNLFFFKVNTYKLLPVNIFFNFLLFYGVSLIIQVFLFEVGLAISLVLILMWLLGMSFVETLVDKVVMKGMEE